MARRIAWIALTALALVVVAALYVLARHVVFLTPTEEVRFLSGDVPLAGTLVTPRDPGPHPAVLLLHGSGPERRADPTTRAVVKTLVRNGYSVLFYDKRGVGESGGDFESAAYSDFIADAVAAVEYLAGRGDVGDPIGLYAVSEGGWFAPEIAVRTGEIDFVFYKVGPPMPVEETVLWEIRNDFLAEGIAEEHVEALVHHTAARRRYYRAAAADPALATGPTRAALEAELASLRRDVPGAELVLPERLWTYDADEYAAFAADTSYDPTPYLLELDIPMHFTFGESDINVPTERCVAVIEELIAENGKDYAVTVFPGVGHSLVSWKGLFDLGFVPGFLETLAQWTRQQIESGSGS